MVRRVAFFRGINVGGHNRVPMAELRDLFAALGCTDVASVIQSGNVVFDSSHSEADLRVAVTAAMIERFGVDSPITLRTEGDMRAAVDAHPFSTIDVEPKLHHIIFLPDSAPTDANRRIGDHRPEAEYLVTDREIHVLYPQGSARSSLTVGLVDRRLKTTATARNVPTCEKVLAALRG